jgi:hypothetical protein
MSKRIFLARPSYGPTEPESDYAAKVATLRDDVEVHSAGFRKSMTCHNFNDHLAYCMNRGGYTHWCLLHADIAPAPGFVDAMLDSLEANDLDVTHVPCRYKNDSQLLMTAMGRPGEVWGPNRQLTTTELADLPNTFDAETLCERWGMPNHILLPNTGCMLWRIGDWIENFPGFRMIDQFGRDSLSGNWVARSVSEDYWFGFWAHEHGVRVGGTKHTTGHWGRREFSSDEIGGAEHDDAYFRVMDAMREAAI